MTRPTVFLVMIKDLIDFSIIASISVALTLGIYQMLPTFTRVDLSVYFFEQWAELFLINQKLFIWLLGLSLGVTIIYFLFCSMLYATTIGGLITGLRIVDNKSSMPMRLHQSLLMAIGAYVGAMALMVGPLWAWWLDQEHRGLAEKLTGTAVVKKNALT